MSDWPAWMGTPTPGVLYRHFDRAGVLLYVGSSSVTRYALYQPLMDAVFRLGPAPKADR